MAMMDEHIAIHVGYHTMNKEYFNLYHEGLKRDECCKLNTRRVLNDSCNYIDGSVSH